MNRVEKFVYDRLKHRPRLKLFARDLWQSLFDRLPAADKISPYRIDVREGYFFGFHDKTPFSSDNRYLLANQYHIPLRMPAHGDSLTVGVFEGEGFQTFRPLSNTGAWNWQQGCMLQWLGETYQFVYNDVEQGRLISRICDAEDGSQSNMDHPVGAVSPDGHYAVGYNFRRVQHYMPGYGYEEGEDPQLHDPAPDQTGMYGIDLNTGRADPLFSIRDIVQLQPDATMEKAWHFFTHCLFSPSNRRFAFIHRWTRGDKLTFRSRLISCNLDGSDLFIFPARDMVSHIAWRDERHLLAYCRIPEGGDHYVLFKDGDASYYRPIGLDVLNSDGHPSYSPDQKWMVTDTYPDRRRQQQLILLNTRTEEPHIIAKVRHPKRYSSRSPDELYRCDLHPRWDRKNRYVCFDSVFTGKRALCTIDLGDLDRTGPKSI